MAALGAPDTAHQNPATYNIHLELVVLEMTENLMFVCLSVRVTIMSCAKLVRCIALVTMEI